MKKIILISLITLGSSLTMNAQWSVSGSTPKTVYVDSSGYRVAIGTGTGLGKLRVQDTGADPSTTSTPNGHLNLTTTSLTNSFGVASSYSWIQSRALESTATYTLSLNPLGGNVGIGTTSPVVKLDVNGSINIASGLNLTWGGAYAANIPTIAAVSGSSSYINFYPGGSTSGPKVKITNGGDVGIGTTSPTNKLDVNGIIRTRNDTAYKPTGGSWTTYSDQRLKKDIAPFKDGLAVLRKVNPVTFKFNGIGDLSIIGTHIGVIAQDIKPVAPYCVSNGTGRLTVKQSESTNFSGEEIIETLPADTLGEIHSIISPLTYNQDGLIYVMINSIKQLDSTNTELAKKDSIKDTQLQAMQNLDSVNTAMQKAQKQSIDSLITKANLQDSIIASLQNQLHQLMETINNCCHNSTQSATEAKSLTEGATTQTDVELNNKNIVVLNQNVPNPFAEQTTISYFLPDNIIRAQIIFSDQSGKIIKTIDLTDKGRGMLNVFANDLTNGIYTYSLIIDGQTIETKRMVKAQ